jgi:carboxymethylenebutenolidase
MTQSQPDGYLAAPAAGTGAPVLVLHAWWGLNGPIRALCDRLAAAGFIAFAPDLYGGQVTDTIAGAEELSGAMDSAAAADTVARAIDFLYERAGRPERGVAIIGFSLGVWYAMEASAADPRVRAVVAYYGSAPIDFAGSQAAYLIHFAENDPYEPREYLDDTLDNLRAAGRPATLHEYAGTGHWFAEPDRPDAYDATAEQLAWERTLAFLSAMEE